MVIAGLFIATLLWGHINRFEILVIVLAIFLVGILTAGILDQKDKRLVSYMVVAGSMGLTGGLIVGFFLAWLTNHSKLNLFIAP